ncbi:MAG: WD40 repeat domain-containing protein [Bacteroidaceae bacterium]|nr:WD40 repeat domain-containing protein [Bacteroidaceae bacterium]
MGRVFFNVASLRRILFFVFVFFVMGGEVAAQVQERTEVQSKKNITDFDNTTFCISYLADGHFWAIRDIMIAQVSDVDKIAFNPAGSSLAILKGKDDITIYSFRERDKKMFELKDKRKGLKNRENLPFELPGEKGLKLMKAASKGDVINLAMCYAPDARHFVTSNSLGEIIIYDTKEYLPQAYIQTEIAVTTMAVSSNNYFIAAAAGKKLDIWNFQTKALRKSITLTGNLNGLVFSDDAAYLAVTTDDQILTVYDTKTWDIAYTFDKLGGNLFAPSFHPEGKYISVVKNNNSIVIVNLKNGKTEQVLDEMKGGIVKRSRFLIDRQSHDIFMISNRLNSLVFWDANALNPFYGKILSDEVNAKMNEWAKMMEGESMEEYAIRVNDETRLKQQQLFAQEVATELAGDRLALENPFVGDYNVENQMLDISFNSLPSISLQVPENEVGDFKDGKKLLFENAVYVLNDKDEFELAYLEVRNETTDKVYIYDNIGRLKMLEMEADDFVPLEIMQQISQEEVQLKEIKEQVVAENKEEQLISDNTQIDVKTEVIPGVDANGNKILNYKVGYQYEVINKAFSANEDFPSGGYNIEKSNAAMSLMKIIKNAFEGDFSKYLSEGKQVKVMITGSADASPIRGRIAYNGLYGEFVDEPYYKDGNLDNITITKASGITSNEQLALMRAAGVKSFIEKNVSTLANTKNEYEFHVEVAKERGGEFRKINVEFLIMDAFPVK